MLGDDKSALELEMTLVAHYGPRAEGPRSTKHNLGAISSTNIYFSFPLKAYIIY